MMIAVTKRVKGATVSATPFTNPGGSLKACKGAFAAFYADSVRSIVALSLYFICTPCGFITDFYTMSVPFFSKPDCTNFADDFKVFEHMLKISLNTLSL
ncbi:MAG: hypothetical protein MI924_23920 [Chloroflexales bacterium]|nr:hypothetical protein [Chloroflexales bacterium]